MFLTVTNVLRRYHGAIYGMPVVGKVMISRTPSQSVWYGPSGGENDDRRSEEGHFQHDQSTSPKMTSI